MFTTFRGNGSSPAEATRRAAKPKRAQVRRACDACRLARAKCDLARPCRHCKQSGRECVSRGLNEFQGVASATREVERLRLRVRELESAQHPASSLLHSPPESEPQDSQSQPQAPPTTVDRTWRWKGINVDGVQYGPISLQFFVQRMSDYLELDVGTQPPPTAVLSAHNVDLSGCEILERHQQDYFMDLFWLAYHINFPIVDEDDLRRLYASLWDPDGRTRRPDPLVDIVLALNIQYAFSFLGLGDPTSEADHTEMAVAGSPFYHRCQDALDHLMESPSITTVQCVFFSAVYLSFARCYNAAHTTLNKASHIASTLAVDDAEPKTIELLTQMRRCMRTLDVRLSIKLGRFTPDRNTPMGSDSDEPLVLDAQQDWTIYHKQMLHLCEVAADVYRTFMHCCNTLFDTNNGTIDFYTNPTTRNTAAKIMSDQIRKLHDWAAQVPPSLRTPRLSGGTADSFSTHRSPCDFTAHNVPQWLQRQRLALECQYHDFCVSLLRLFIHFAPTPDRGTFAADDNCISCVNHAVLLTNLIAQATHETDILKGCYQAFEWQQNAAYALAGFAAGYPVCPPTPSARKALGAAREMFQSFGTGNSAAVRMAALSGELDGAIAGIVARFKRGMGLTPDSAVASAPRSVAVHDIGEHTTTTLDLMGPLWDGVDVDASHLWGLSSLGQDIWETLPTDLDLGSNPT